MTTYVDENELWPELRDLAKLRHNRDLRELAEFQESQKFRQRNPAPRCDLARMLFASGPDGVGGEDKEFLQEEARKAGRSFDPYRPFITFRTLQAAIGSQGGYFTESDVRDLIDILRPWSALARAGVTVETGLIGDQSIPRIATDLTAQWLSTGTSQITPNQPVLGPIPLSPKQVGGLIPFSRQLGKQVNAPIVVAGMLMRAIGTKIDDGLLNGTGAAGQLLGLLNTIGIQTQSGTTLNAGVNAMKRKSAEANAADEQIKFGSTPLVRELLEPRERAAGGGRFVWDKDQVADRPAFVSTQMPTATMICGDWSLVYFGVWGDGFVLELNPYDQVGFKSGVVQARMIVSCDSAVLHPSAFVKATSIT